VKRSSDAAFTMTQQLPPASRAATPPVVLLGGINLVRTLGLAGLPAIVASSDPDEPAFASRYCVEGCLLPASDNPEAIAATLVALGTRLSIEEGCRIPIMYGSDDALQLLYRYRDRLERYFLFLVSDPAVGNSLIAKDRFQRMARQRGLPVPRSLVFEGDGPGTLRGTAGPVLVKPSTKVDWHHTVLCQRLFGGDGKARIFASGAEAAGHEVVAEFRDQLTFQEYVPGGDDELWSFHGFADENGEVLASFIGRKVRTYPTLTGESAFIELAHDDSLEALGREVARRCPLKGVFKMDFKRDPRNGHWYLLEINARYTLWHYLAASNGLNLARTTYDYLMYGMRPPERRASRDYRWLSLELDFRAYRELAARGELTATAWARSILGSRNVYNLFAWRDPEPWLRFWLRRVARRLDRALFRFTTAFRQWRSTAS
jgi:D-aspartate ligase